MMLSLSPWNAGLSEIVGLWIGLGMWTGLKPMHWSRVNISKFYSAV